MTSRPLILAYKENKVWRHRERASAALRVQNRGGGAASCGDPSVLLNILNFSLFSGTVSCLHTQFQTERMSPRLILDFPRQAQISGGATLNPPPLPYPTSLCHIPSFSLPKLCFLITLGSSFLLGLLA